MRGTPGPPDAPALEPAAASLTSISHRKGDILYSVLLAGGAWKEGKQFQPLQKLGTSTKAVNVMSMSTKRNINRRGC